MTDEGRVAGRGWLAEAVAARERYRAALEALEAEFVRFRRRSVRELTAALEEGGADLILKLLPVLDACDAAARCGAEEVARVGSALGRALSEEGVERIERTGQPFDPCLEEAVGHLGGEGPLVVDEVVQVGYRMRKRLLRPARVVVRGCAEAPG